MIFMKTLNNKGFMLTETLIVTMIVASFILFMYAQVYNVMNNYHNQMGYETPKALYALGNLRDYIYNDGQYESLASDFETRVYKNLTADHFSNSEYATKLFESMGIKRALLMKNNLTTLRSFSYENDFDENLKAYIKSIEQKDQEASYFILVSLNNGEYGSLPLYKNQKDISVQIQGSAQLTVSSGNKVSFTSGLTASTKTGVDVSNLIECIGNVDLNQAGSYRISCFVDTEHYSSNIFVRQVEVQA